MSTMYFELDGGAVVTPGGFILTMLVYGYGKTLSGEPEARHNAIESVDKLLWEATLGGFTQADILKTLADCWTDTERIGALCHEAAARIPEDRFVAIFRELDHPVKVRHALPEGDA